MRTAFIQVEHLKGNDNGKAYDFDRYVFERQTPMSTQDWSIVVDFQNTNIEGDAIRYGSWDTLVIEECLECLATLEQHQIRRDFSHMLTPEVYPTLGSKEEQAPQAPQAAPVEEEETQMYNEAGEPIDTLEEGELPYTEGGDILVLDDMVLNNEQIGVEFMSTYENKADGWKAYEFQTNDFLHFAFYGNGGSLFRLELGTDEQGEEYAAVNVAYSEDYTCMEDVTGYFNTDELIRIMRDTTDITDVQDDYENWCEEEGEEY